MSFNEPPVHGQPLDDNERDELKARIAELEKSDREALEAREKDRAKIEELKRRNAELRKTADTTDPALKPFLDADIEQAKAKMDESRALVQRNPASSEHLVAFRYAKQAYDTAVAQWDTQFPAEQPIPRTLSRLQEGKLHELRQNKEFAKSQVRKDPSDNFALEKFRSANLALDRFAKALFRDFGLRLPD